MPNTTLVCVIVHDDGTVTLTADMGAALHEKEAHGGHIHVLSSLLEQGKAWEQVAKTLQDCDPHWLELGGVIMSPVDMVCDMLKDYMHLLENKHGQF